MFENDLIECCLNLKLMSNIGYKNGNLNPFSQADILKVVFLFQKKDEENQIITNSKCLLQLNDNRFVYYSIKYNSATNKLHGFGLVDNNLNRMIQLGLDAGARNDYYANIDVDSVKYEGVELDFTRKTIEGLESIKL